MEVLPCNTCYRIFRG